LYKFPFNARKVKRKSESRKHYKAMNTKHLKKKKKKKKQGKEGENTDRINGFLG
jgi:hypothetical protein